MRYPRAVVEYDHHFMGTRIALISTASDDFVARINFDTGRRESVRRSEQPGERIEPSFLHITEEEARALLDELAHYFGNVPETANLRKDYEAERTRVDKFIDAVISSTQALRTDR